MKKGTLLSAVCQLAFVIVLGVARYAPAMYGRADIWIPEKEQPLDISRLVCEKQAKPRFTAELKKQNPAINEKELAKEIVIRADEKKNTIIIYVPAEEEPTAVKNAVMIAEMAVRELVRRAESRQRETLYEITAERQNTRQIIRKMEDDLVALQKKEGMYNPQKEMDSLVGRLSSYKEELAQAEMRCAELEAKLTVLLEKAADVKDTVSPEEVAELEKTARQLAAQLDEQSAEKAVEKCELTLKHNEQKLSRLLQMFKQAAANQAAVEDARFEFEMARHEYERVKQKMVDLERRLKQVGEDLAKAKESLAETGGLGLATIIAERTLECETELAAAKVKSRWLQLKMQDLHAEIASKGSMAADFERHRADIDLLEKQLQALSDREVALQAKMKTAERPQVIMVKPVERLEEERPLTYSVIGEVRVPGSYELAKETTILKAVAAAGDFTDYADERKVVVLRETKQGSKRYEIDVRAILRESEPDFTATEFTLEPGDIVWVPRRGVF